MGDWVEGVDQHGEPMPWVLSWAAARETLADRRLSPRSFVDDMLAAGLSPATAAQVAPLFSRHGDDHRRLRSVLASAFTPRKVEQLRPFAAAVADRLADAMEAAGPECEFVASFATPLPPEVFATLFGLPVEDSAHLARWASAISLAFGGLTADTVGVVEAAAAEMRAYGLARIEVVRSAPGDDLVTRLVAEGLDDDEVVAMITGFVFAGAETTRRQLTAAMTLFAEHPDAWERLAAEPDLLANAVDEVLRVRPIVPALTRRAEEPYERGDLGAAVGDRLLVVFTSANADPERFDDPTAFVVDRPDAHAHVTFGWGPHLCVGAGLARLELAESLRCLTTRFGPPAVVAEGPSTGFGAPDWLRLELRPR